MFWYFYKGLEPYLQRAHAGHTQAGSSNGGQRSSLNSGFPHRRGWPIRSPFRNMLRNVSQRFVNTIDQYQTQVTST